MTDLIPSSRFRELRRDNINRFFLLFVCLSVKILGMRIDEKVKMVYKSYSLRELVKK